MTASRIGVAYAVALIPTAMIAIVVDGAVIDLSNALQVRGSLWYGWAINVVSALRQGLEESSRTRCLRCV